MRYAASALCVLIVSCDPPARGEIADGGGGSRGGSTSRLDGGAGNGGRTPERDASEVGSANSDAETSAVPGIEAFHNTSREDIELDLSLTPVVIDASNSHVFDEGAPGQAGQGPILRIDRAGNIYVIQHQRVFQTLEWSGSGYRALLAGNTFKLSPTFEMLWKQDPGIPSCALCGRAQQEAFESRGDHARLPSYAFKQRVEVVDVDADGRSFFGGLMTGVEGQSIAPEPSMTEGDALVGELDAEGQLLWFDRIATEDGTVAFVSWLGFGPDGSLFAFGRSLGLMPDQESDAVRGGPFLVRYNVNGEREWIRQYEVDSFSFGRDTNLRNPLFIDAAGTVYAPISGFASTLGARYSLQPGGLDLVALLPIAAGGDLRERLTRSSALNVSERSVPSAVQPVLAHDGESYYAAGTVRALQWMARQAGDDDPLLGNREYLLNEQLDASRSWSRGFAGVVVDTQSGIEGNIRFIHRVIATADSLYLCGTARRTEAGREVSLIYATRLTLDGETSWQQQLRPVERGNVDGCAISPNGTLVVAFVTRRRSESFFEAMNFVSLALDDGRVVF